MTRTRSHTTIHPTQSLDKGSSAVHATRNAGSSAAHVSHVLQVAISADAHGPMQRTTTSRENVRSPQAPTGSVWPSSVLSVARRWCCLLPRALDRPDPNLVSRIPTLSLPFAPVCARSLHNSACPQRSHLHFMRGHVRPCRAHILSRHVACRGLLTCAPAATAASGARQRCPSASR